MKRNEARKQAICLLFEKIFNPQYSWEAIIENASDGRDLVVDEYALKLVKAVEENQEEIDKVLQEYSKKRKLNRLPRIVLSILRAAYCEMRYFDDIPVGVSINEAVELTKLFAGEEEAPFVNGILGAINRSNTQEG
ncbi:MAG: transcription antitermination factor NusB [Oscillospiraceae bacterium]|nr:transcription antitermination factor NusB [Oscillospiraceae bacterium]